MHKIGLTGNLGCDLATPLKTFKSRGYETIDVGKLISDAFLSEDVITQAFTECEEFGIDTTVLSATRNGKLIAVEENVLNMCIRDERMLDIWMKHVKAYVVKHAYRTILQTTCKMIVISTTLVYEFGLDWMFDDIVTVTSTPEAMIDYACSLPDMNKKRYESFQTVYAPLHEKRRMSSYYIDSSQGDAQTVLNTLQLINMRLERNF